MYDYDLRLVTARSRVVRNHMLRIHSAAAALARPVVHDARSCQSSVSVKSGVEESWVAVRGLSADRTPRSWRRASPRRSGRRSG